MLVGRFYRLRNAICGPLVFASAIVATPALAAPSEAESPLDLASLRASYEKAPQLRVLYSIGQLCARIGDAPCAISAYERYLKSGGSAISAARREAVEQEIEALPRTLGTVRVRTSLNGAAVSVDDIVVGKTPLAKPVVVGVGKHTIKLAYA